MNGVGPTTTTPPIHTATNTTPSITPVSSTVAKIAALITLVLAIAYALYLHLRPTPADSSPENSSREESPQPQKKAHATSVNDPPVEVAPAGPEFLPILNSADEVKACTIKGISSKVSEKLFAIGKTYLHTGTIGPKIGCILIDLSTGTAEMIQASDDGPIDQSEHKSILECAMTIYELMVQSNLLSERATRMEEGANKAFMEIMYQPQRGMLEDLHKDRARSSFFRETAIANKDRVANTRFFSTGRCQGHYETLSFFYAPTNEQANPLPTMIALPNNTNFTVVGTEGAKDRIAQLAKSREGLATKEFTYHYPAIDNNTAPTTMWAFKNEEGNGNPFHAAPSKTFIDQKMEGYDASRYYTAEDPDGHYQTTKLYQETPFIRFSIVHLQVGE